MAGKGIEHLLDDPGALESLYRGDAAGFRTSFEEAARGRESEPAVRFWRARLDAERTVGAAVPAQLGIALAIALCIGALVRLPALWLNEVWYYPRFAPIWAAVGVASYLWITQRRRSGLLGGAILTVAAGAYLSLLPGTTTFGDSVAMALLFMPILFWALVGVAFTGRQWRTPASRLQFIHYNGEAFILAVLVTLGGGVFSAVAIGLFSLIVPDPAEWFMPNIGLIGAVSIPLAATFLYDAVLDRRAVMAPILVQMFTPVFLVMGVGFLVTSLVMGQNPFSDRDFLIAVNGLLLLILAMTVLSVAARDGESGRRWIDYTGAAMLGVTLFINGVALAAIAFRLSSFGFTPNRVVVLGSNLVAMGHLVWMCAAYVRFFRGRAPLAGVQRVATGYLPVYVAWAAVVVFVLPAVFSFG